MSIVYRQSLWFSFLVVISLVTFFNLTTPTVQAEEEITEYAVIADVNFMDQKIISQQGHNLRVSITLKNMIGTQSGILYGLNVYREVDGQQFIVDQFVPFDPIVLTQNETVTKEFNYTLPQILQGEVFLFAFAETERGVPLASASLGSVNLTESVLNVDLKECTFSSNQTIDCLLENTSDTVAQAIIDTRVIEGNSTLGPTLFTLPAQIIELEPGEIKTHSSELGIEIPPEGLFIENILFDASSSYPSEKFNFSIPAWESSYKISNLLIEQKNALDYLVKVILLNQQTEEMTAKVSLIGESGECTTKTVTLNGSVTEVLFNLDSFCQTTAIKADLINQSGDIVDSLDVPHLSLFAVSYKSQSEVYIYYIVTALALLLLILIVLKRVKFNSSVKISCFLIGLFVLSVNNAAAATIVGSKTYVNNSQATPISVTVNFTATYPSQLQANHTGYFNLTSLSGTGGYAVGLAKNDTPPPMGGLSLNIGSNNWTSPGTTPFSHINTGTFTLSFTPYLRSPNPSSGWTSNPPTAFVGSIEIIPQTTSGGGGVGSGYSITAGPVVCEDNKAKINISWTAPGYMPGEVTMNDQPFAESYAGNGNKWTTTDGNVGGEGLLTPNSTYTFKLYSVTVYTNNYVTVTANCSGSGGYTPPNNSYQYRCAAANSGNSCAFSVNQPCASGEVGCFSGSSAPTQCANYCGSQRYTCGGGCVACGQTGQPECSNGNYTSYQQCRDVCEWGSEVSCGYLPEATSVTVGETTNLSLTTQYPIGGTPGTVGGSGQYHNVAVNSCEFNTVPNVVGGNTDTDGFWYGPSSPLLLGANVFNASCTFDSADYSLPEPVFQSFTVNCLSNGVTGEAGPATNLESQNLVLNSGNLVNGGSVSFRGEVSNNGETNITTNFSNNFTYCWGAGCAPSSVLSTHTQNSLNIGVINEDTSDSLSLLQTGTLRIQYCVDSNNNVAESDEGDNCLIEDYSVTPPIATGEIFANPPNCIVAVGESTCTSNITWNTSHATNPNVRTGSGVLFSNNANGNNETSPSITPGTSLVLNVHNNSNGTVLASVSVNASCESGSAWNGSLSVCEASVVTYPPPTITIESNPSIIRSGAKAPVEVNINGAEYELRCAFSGAVSSSNNFTHVGTPGNGNYSGTFESIPLTAARVAKVTCTDPDDAPYSEETTISVIPTFQEI